MIDTLSRYLMVFLLFSAALAVFSGVSHAKSAESSDFDPVYIEKNVKLILRGTGLFRWMGIIKAYRGGFYLPGNIASENLFENVPKRLVLEYFHEIKAVDFYRATRKHVEKYTDKKIVAKIEQQLTALGKTYRNVRPGDRYALTYLPGTGTSLYLNDQGLGTFEGEIFSRVLFAIWLGEHPIDEKFRDQLLGRK